MIKSTNQIKILFLWLDNDGPPYFSLFVSNFQILAHGHGYWCWPHEMLPFDTTFVLEVQLSPSTVSSTLLSRLYKSAAHREPKSNAREAGDNHYAIRPISHSNYMRDGLEASYLANRVEQAVRDAVNPANSHVLFFEGDTSFPQQDKTSLITSLLKWSMVNG